MQLSIWQILDIMITSGILGGIMNFLLIEYPENGRKNLIASMFIGVGASLLVPLFLNTLESNIIDKLSQADSTISEIFIFSGFCLLASISSKAFIQTLTSKILKEAKKAKKMASKAEIAVIENSHQLKDIKSKVDAIAIDAKFKIANKQIDSALSLYDQILIMSPDDIHTKIEKAVALSKRDRPGDIEQASLILNNLPDKDLNNSDLPLFHLYKARCLYNLACFLNKREPEKKSEILSKLKECFGLYNGFKDIAPKDSDLKSLYNDIDFLRLLE